MPTTITINGISGTSPFDIYLCDNPITTCIYINTISSTPYSFDVPIILDGQDDFNIKVIDNNDCETITILTP
jgi:hypothetical protein